MLHFCYVIILLTKSGTSSNVDQLEIHNINISKNIIQMSITINKVKELLILSG